MKMMVLAGLAVLVVAGMLYQAVGARRAARRFAPPGMLIDAGGQRLHAVCAGDGSPLVLFEAGIAASSLSWTRVAPAVAAFARTCAYDRAGLGWSNAAVAPRTVEQMIAELDAVLTRTAAAEPAILVGHSFGAFLVLVYAARYRERVAGVVLVDPPTEWHPLTEQRAWLLRRGIQASHLGGALARIGVVRACLALLTGGAPGAPRTFVRLLGPRALRTLEHLVGEVRKLPPDVHPAVQALWCQPKCFRGMADHLGALGVMGAAAADVTTLGDVPLAIVSGGDQPPVVLAQHGALATLSSRGRHVVAAQSGHWVHLDQPEIIVEAIKEICSA